MCYKSNIELLSYLIILPTDSYVKLLEWKGFLITTKFCYAFYLIQIPIFQLSIANMREIRYYSSSSMINLNELFVICSTAVLMTLLIETPFNNIKKLLFTSKKTDENSNEVKGSLAKKVEWRWHCNRNFSVSFHSKMWYFKSVLKVWCECCRYNFRDFYFKNKSVIQRRKLLLKF